MSTVNIWLGMSEAATNVARTSLNWDEETQGPYSGPLRNRSRLLFKYMQSRVARESQFLRPTIGGTDYRMWSLDFEDDTARLLLVEEEILYLQGQYPNQIAILGAWKRDGAMVGCQLVINEVPNPEYTGEPYWIPNPDYQPDPELPDYDPNENIRNPAWVPEFIAEHTQTGTPRHALHARTIDFMPNAALEDVNLLLGQQPRIFS